MIDTNALISGQQLETGSSEGVNLDLAAVRRADELLTALGLTPEISLSGYGELLEVRFVRPTDVNVKTVLDQKKYTIGFRDGRAELWLDEEDSITSFNCQNVAVRYEDGTLTFRDLKETIEADSEDRSSAPIS